MSVSQKQKSIAALHDAAQSKLGIGPILEVSSKSTKSLGVDLSAFNLTFRMEGRERSISVECAFQGSKVFQSGGPFTDMFDMAPRDAKRDDRLLNSGQLMGFRFKESDWGLEPQTAFYDWLYINALMRKRNPPLADYLEEYSAFTDIEFNPNKSINCQAYSAALFLSLKRRGTLEHAVSSKQAFLETLAPLRVNNARQDDVRQGSLL